jgi:hypothetical protein
MYKEIQFLAMQCDFYAVSYPCNSRYVFAVNEHHQGAVIILDARIYRKL